MIGGLVQQQKVGLGHGRAPASICSATSSSSGRWPYAIDTWSSETSDISRTYHESGVAEEGAAGAGEVTLLRRRQLGKCQVQLFERLHDDVGDERVREPLVVRRNHVPGC